jgi:hypothetical protein
MYENKMHLLHDYNGRLRTPITLSFGLQHRHCATTYIKESDMHNDKYVHTML